MADYCYINTSRQDKNEVTKESVEKMRDSQRVVVYGEEGKNDVEDYVNEGSRLFIYDAESSKFIAIAEAADDEAIRATDEEKVAPEWDGEEYHLEVRWKKWYGPEEGYDRVEVRDGLGYDPGWSPSQTIYPINKRDEAEKVYESMAEESEIEPVKESSLHKYWERISGQRERAQEFLENPSRENLMELGELLHATQAYNDLESIFVDDILNENQSLNNVAKALTNSIETESPEETRQLDGFGWATASEVLRALQPDEFAILNKKSVSGMEALGYSTPDQYRASVDQYWGFVEDVREAFNVHDLDERVKSETDISIPDWATELEIADMAFYMHTDGVIDLESTTEPIPDSPDRAKEIERQLKSEGQVVFYGPPGTSKTYTAQRFARWWINEQADGDVKNKIRTVTFHPSFSYEDFVEGLTVTTTEDGQAQYKTEDGVFKDFARKAKRDYLDTEGSEEPDPYVLIIDEINRGNLSQIFGENITLLEKDKRLEGGNETRTELAHSGKSFVVPPNLYIIGTMNTASQSIALVDTALRRRFRFLQYPPDTEELIQYYDFDSQKELHEIADSGDSSESILALSILAVERLNDRILKANDLNKGKQIGHTYLMLDEDYDSQDVVDVWRYDILPLLEEYYFSQFERMERELFKGAEESVIQDGRIEDFGVSDLADFLTRIVDLDLSPEPYISEDGGENKSSGDSNRVNLGEYNEMLLEDIYERLGDTFQAESPEDLEGSTVGIRSGVTVKIESNHPEHTGGDNYQIRTRPHDGDEGIYIMFHNRGREVGLMEKIKREYEDFPPDEYEYNPDTDWGALKRRWPIEVDPDIDTEDMDDEDARLLYETLKEDGTLDEVLDEFTRMSEKIHQRLVELDLEEE